MNSNMTQVECYDKEWVVKYVDLKKHYNNYKEPIHSVIEKTFAAGDFILRDDVLEFEKNVANYVGAKYAIGVNSGTDALFLSCIAAGIDEGDEIITVGHTFVATVAAIHHCKAVPILIDIKDDYNIDESKICRAITNKTKAIIPVHLNGRSCHMEEICSIAKKHGLIVIEDACQAIGAKFNNKHVGTFGMFGCFSLHPMKSLSCAGDGGYIVTDDKKKYDRLISLRNHGQSENKKEIHEFGFNSRLDNIQAAIANVKLKYLDKNNDIRRSIALKYNEGLENLPVILPKRPDEDSVFYDVYNSYVIMAEQRDELYNFLRDNYIEVFVHMYKPLTEHNDLQLNGFDLEVNQEVCNKILSLPIYPELSQENIEYVIFKVTEFYNKYNEMG